MAEVDVKNQSSKQNTESKQRSQNEQGAQSGTQGLERQQQRGLSRGRNWDPWGFGPSPAEFFSGNPFTLMRRMSEEMDRTFNEFFGQSRGESSSWYPAVEVAERNGQLQIHAELPGIKPEDVKVEITDDRLILHGERKSEHEHHVGKAYRSERRYGEFYREIALPEGVKGEEAKAQFRDGVLEVMVPMPQQATRRREIPIGSGDSGGKSQTATAGGGNQKS